MAFFSIPFDSRTFLTGPDGSYSIRHQAVINARTGEAQLAIHISGQGLPVMGDLYRDTMYYNPDGGIYFHHDADCWTVDAAFRPLRGIRPRGCDP